jgi:hypothetical protein
MFDGMAVKLSVVRNSQLQLRKYSSTAAGDYDDVALGCNFSPDLQDKLYLPHSLVNQPFDALTALLAIAASLTRTSTTRPRASCAP